MNRILVVAAHPDDELLGVGGTIRRLANEGKECRALILAEGLTSRVDRDNEQVYTIDNLQSDGRKAASIIGYKSIDFCRFPDNRMDSIDLLEIIKIVNQFVMKYKPDTIFTHHSGDLNIDHRLTCESVVTACRPLEECGVKRIYTFETPSSSELEFNYIHPFCPNVFFDISKTIDSKIEGMKCYKSEIRNYPHPRSPDALKALAEFRGSNVGFDMAECFMLLRECFD